MLMNILLHFLFLMILSIFGIRLSYGFNGRILLACGIQPLIFCVSAGVEEKIISIIQNSIQGISGTII